MASNPASDGITGYLGRGMNAFLAETHYILRDREYKVCRERWYIQAQYWAMRRPVRMYLLAIAAFAFGMWL